MLSYLDFHGLNGAEIESTGGQVLLLQLQPLGQQLVVQQHVVQDVQGDVHRGADVLQILSLAVARDHSRVVLQQFQTDRDDVHGSPQLVTDVARELLS